MEFYLKVVLSFLIGGSYVLGVVLASEKLGSKIGAAIAGLPSTILIGLVFIVLTSNVEAGQQAVAIVPYMFSATLIFASIFVAVFARSRSNPYIKALVLATAVWLGYSLTIRQLSDFPFVVAVVFGFISLLLFRYAFRNFETVKPKKTSVKQTIYVLRFIVGGLVIASSVVAAYYLDPTWGGIVASFPAMLGVILYFLCKSQGPDFLKSMLKSLPISYVSSLCFIVVFYMTITAINPVLSVVLGMALALSIAYFLATFKRSTN